MTESITLGSVHLIGEHMPAAVRVTVINDLERPAGFLITTAQWNSLLALADTKLAGEREVERLKSENARLKQAIWAVIDTFEDAARNFENRGKGGQQVPFHGDFASMPPSSASTMKRWSRDLRLALIGKWPMTREECAEKWPQISKEALDEMFKERQP